MSATSADIIVERLPQWGVRRIHGYPWDAVYWAVFAGPRAFLLVAVATWRVL